MESDKIPTSAEQADIERRATTHQSEWPKSIACSPVFILATIGVFGTMETFLLFLYG